MRVLVLQRNAQTGGGNTYLRVLTPELRRRGDELRLMIGSGPDRPALARAFGSRPWWNPPLMALATPLAALQARLHRAQVVNAHTLRTARVALAACRRADIPVVLHLHGVAPLEEAAEVLDRVAGVVVMDRTVGDWVARVPGVAEKTTVSVLPVDTERFRPAPAPHAGFHLVFCGRLNRRKAACALMILESFPELSAAIPGLRMSVVGGRSQLERVAERAREVNAGLGREAVQVHGLLLDPSPVIAAADLVVGAGYVALEALACARHVIGVGTAGLTGLVTRGNLEASVDANFGDHAGFEREVTAGALRREVLRGYEAWRAEPAVEWGPGLIRERFCAARAADDVQRAFERALRGR